MGLDDLRDELRRIDRRILELIADRQRLATSVGEAKRDLGRPLRDYRQERTVLERARDDARALGISPSLAETVVLALVRASLTVQEQQQIVAAATGSGQRALVIGGAGRMGSWLARFLTSQGCQVEVADPAGSIDGCIHLSDWRTSALDQDFIAVAAPLRTTNDVLHELATRPFEGVAFDVGSLKSPLRSGLAALRTAGRRVTSVHPMFGPDTDLLSGRHVIFVDVGVSEATVRVRKLFESTMAVQVEMSLEDHDRVIAYVLGLSHATNIAFFTALGQSGEAAPRLAEVSSTTFEDQLSVAARVAAENPALYFEIQSLNDYGSESLTALLHAVERLRAVVRAGDERAFSALMERGRTYLSERERGT